MIEEIASDFYRIEVPLPEIQLKSVNPYVIKDRGEIERETEGQVAIYSLSENGWW